MEDQEERKHPETSASVSEQLKRLQKRHASDLKRAHEYEAAIYWQNAQNLYLSTRELPENHPYFHSHNANMKAGG